MLSGVLNPDNFSQALRDISQRRRQGELDIHAATTNYCVLFIQGRIVEVQEAGQNSIEQIFNILRRSGLVPAEFEFSGEPGYAELLAVLKALAPAVNVSEETFRDVLKHRVLDTVYSIGLLKEGYFTFNVKMVDCQRELLPAITVGQLLLDLVDLGNEGSRLEKLMAENPWLSRVPLGEQALSGEERLLYDLAAEGDYLSSLKEKCYLSRYHFQQSLFSLMDQKILQIGAPGRGKVEEESQIDGLFKALEKTIDSSFAIAPEGEESAADLEGGEIRTYARDVPAPKVEEGESERLPEDKNGALARADIRTALYSLNSRLLQSSLIPNLVLVVFFACALIAPVLYWSRALLGIFQGDF